MPKRASIILNRKYLNRLSKEQEINFILGCIYYEEYTNENTKAIAFDEAIALPDNELKAILYSIILSNLCFSSDNVAFNTLKVIIAVLVERSPDILLQDTIIEEFKRGNNYLFPS